MASLPLFDRLPEHRCFWGFTFLFNFTSSLTVCLSIAAFMASLPVFDPLPEHCCFCGFTFLFDPLPEHCCFYGFTSSSTVGPSSGCRFFAAFVASFPHLGSGP